jgi:Xaa-Pro aminopeptidase
VERSLDAFLVTSRSNILYLTNFAGSAGVALVDHAGVRLLTDSRYLVAVRELQSTASACPDLEIEDVAGSYDTTLVALLERIDARTIGFEAEHMTVHRHDWLTRTLETSRSRAQLVATESTVEQSRIVKDDHELAVLAEAGRRLSDVAVEVFTRIRAGRAERAIAADIDFLMRNGGFERPAFETIVASGPNAALPHARPSERTLGEGDLVVLDFGGVYDSYCVDLTRTVAVGSASPRAREVYDAVRTAQRQAIAAVTPGASRFGIDAAARTALQAAGMGEAFGHGTGHGLGLDIHEAPRIVQLRPGVDTRDEAIAENMVFTVEPGAYFPGWGGVRIEDDIAVTQDGARLLTTVTTELLEL